jgi:hypothetical protein
VINYPNPFVLEGYMLILIGEKEITINNKKLEERNRTRTRFGGYVPI